jgi:hypothetical protein
LLFNKIFATLAKRCCVINRGFSELKPRKRLTSLSDLPLIRGGN